MLIFTYFIPTYGLLYLLFTLLVNLLFTVKKIFYLLLTLNNLLVNFHLLTSKNHGFGQKKNFFPTIFPSGS